MKKLLVCCILIMVSMFSIVSCGTKEPAEDKTYDDAFLSDVVKGLENRWAITQKDNESEKDCSGRAVDAELNVIAQYTDKKFQDSNLQEKAITYINLLKEQKEALQYYDADYDTFYDKWNAGYAKRCQTIADLINTYSLKFDSKYQSIVEEIVNGAKVANENEEYQAKQDEMTNSIEFTLLEENYGLKTYTGTIENITDKTLSISLEINLIDDKNTIIDTTYASAQNVKPGQKATLEFMTEDDFATYEISAEYYDY